MKSIITAHARLLSKHGMVFTGKLSVDVVATKNRTRVEPPCLCASNAENFITLNCSIMKQSNARPSSVFVGDVAL